MIVSTYYLNLRLRVDIAKLGSNGNLIVPNLPERLVARHIPIIIPRIGIQPHAELINLIVIDRRRDIEPFKNLLAIEPDLVEARILTLPTSLDHHAVPDTSLDRGKVVKLLNVSATIRLAVVPTDNSRRELVALNPEHGGGHPVIAATASTRSLSNELRKIESLTSKLPALTQTERKAVEALVTALVAIVNVDFGVVASGVGSVVGLGHLEGGGLGVGGVGHLLDDAVVFFADVIPAIQVAVVVEEARGGNGEDGHGGGDESSDGDHFDDFGKMF